MITTENGMRSCGCRSVGECTHNTFAEVRALDMLVAVFAEEMAKKLHRKWAQGHRGWDDPSNADSIRRSLIEHAQRGAGQEVDVASMAAMLWNFSQVTP